MKRQKRSIMIIENSIKILEQKKRLTCKQKQQLVDLKNALLTRKYQPETTLKLQKVSDAYAGPRKCLRVEKVRKSRTESKHVFTVFDGKKPALRTKLEKEINDSNG